MFFAPACNHHEPALADKELSIDRDLQGIGEGIRFRRHADDREELSILLVGEALGAGCCGVRVDAVAATVRRGYRYIDQLFCERIERSGFHHHLFDARPGSLKKGRLVRESTSEVVHEI